MLKLGPFGFAGQIAQLTQNAKQIILWTVEAHSVTSRNNPRFRFSNASSSASMSGRGRRSLSPEEFAIEVDLIAQLGDAAVQLVEGIAIEKRVRTASNRSREVNGGMTRFYCV
jgi:hypothetical protein